LQDAPANETVKRDKLPLNEEVFVSIHPTNVNVSRETLEQLEVTDLCYIYPNGNLGIDKVSFTLKRNSFTVITGRIGAGKTTLLRALLGLVPKTSGDIVWNGTLVHDPASFFVPPRSAYTAQVPRLFSDTLGDNILLGEHHDDTNHLETASRLAVLEHDIQRLERGYHTMVGSRGVKLSGGQIQRSAAARMFARNSDLLVFDDVSSALDVATENHLWQMLFAERHQHSANEVTCLVVSHRKAALERADNILVMQAGRVIAAGKLDDLLETCEEMQYLWSSQT
jgi:ABC-type multidrug transport system fused ATPase/permease subunit